MRDWICLFIYLFFIHHWIQTWNLNGKITFSTIKSNTERIKSETNKNKPLQLSTHPKATTDTLTPRQLSLLFRVSIVTRVTQVFEVLHLYLGAYHVFMSSVNWGREVKSLTSWAGEFQILASSVFKHSSCNSVVFVLLTNKSSFLLAHCGSFSKYVLIKSGFLVRGQ